MIINKMFKLTLHWVAEIIQTLTVWSLEHEAKNWPQGETLTFLAHSRWPVKVLTQYLEMIQYKNKIQKIQIVNNIFIILPSIYFPHFNCFIPWRRNYEISSFKKTYSRYTMFMTVHGTDTFICLTEIPQLYTHISTTGN